ncbi:MAG: putative transmembrane protein [Roseibaca calidilacus]|uniref:Putative transmembrane protein n=1 Tax=Roseibaca calidilacus TaxID=1666912 RepID=A0A0P7W0W4_9RHOB|nr:TIGR02186 family protein [Roseibaca calidilacus]KPP93474.1 MAG: putative transmembrane protein [Roseibaca calidilacus]CUX80602.1 conserved hypothetical protein [Roseibaca calidilacus]
MGRVLALVVWLLCLTPAQAQEEVVAGLSQNSVALTVNFVGSDILIFGAVRRDGTIPDGPLDVVVTVEGPPQEATIWRKARRAGIWVNTESQNVRAAPSFYAVASTAPLTDILSPEADLDYRISTRLAIFEARSGGDVTDPAAFTEALIRIRTDEGLYQEGQTAVALERDTLFTTRITLPKNIVEGSYVARIFLLRDGAVVDEHETFIEVRKAVLERWLYSLAYDQPAIYGLLSLFVAAFFGWGASALFRLMRS